jgi:hypothetical protein
MACPAKLEFDANGSEASGPADDEDTADELTSDWTREEAGTAT